MRPVPALPVDLAAAAVKLDVGGGDHGIVPAAAFGEDADAVAVEAVAFNAGQMALVDHLVEIGGGEQEPGAAAAGVRLKRLYRGLFADGQQREPMAVRILGQFCIGSPLSVGQQGIPVGSGVSVGKAPGHDEEVQILLRQDDLQGLRALLRRRCGGPALPASGKQEQAQQQRGQGFLKLAHFNISFRVKSLVLRSL
ncbi:MAG: hypothetical protein Q4C45_09950 [Oscillospiraceae bacterium]|nr:hypothetical protein [Oscillospiraceae bacterium]